MVRKKDQIVYKLPDNVQISSIGEEQHKRLMEEIQSLHAATMMAAQQASLPETKPIAPKALSLSTPPQPTAAEADAMKETARKLREELEQQQRYQQQEDKSPRKYNKTGKYSKKRPLSTPHKEKYSLPDSILSKRLPEEELQHREIKKRFLGALAKDHTAVTQPDTSAFRSLEDAVQRLLPYHIYHYPKADLDANKISEKLQDTAILDIFKCQAELFDKYQQFIEKLNKADDTLSMKILMGRQIMADQRQKMAEEQARVTAEQVAIRKEQQRIQNERAQLSALVSQGGFDSMGMF
ncbi:hypothetical protein BY458DRAFT_436324 [Sporodiniella umbellata]|nr:hypothetical protein BY458DRAFT_436324 [Sporodiniella umbellata]